ncbi:hypothetical protein CHU92_02650, partial [Flavobacterium cyanobacteriorum]
MRNKYLFLVLAVFTGLNIFAQGNTAAGMQAFCAGGSALTFNNTTNSPAASLTEAQSYGCLATRPNPAWFYLRIDQAGNLNFTISQVNNAGGGIDVDFIAWGPFPGPPPIFGPANLNPGTQIGCSYSTAAVENFTIPNAQPGQYYVVLITNFSNQAGQISLTQTNAGQPGAGSTNCNIVCPLTLGDNFTLCPGDTAILEASIASELNRIATYSWTFNGSPITGANTRSITISTPGVYTVTVNKPGCIANATATVTVSLPPPLPIPQPLNLFVCQAGTPPYTYNLLSNTQHMLQNEDPTLFEVSYFLTQQDALQDVNAITSPDAYQSAGNQTIYVRIYKLGECVEVRSFQLLLNQAPTATQPAGISLCDADNDGLAVFNLTQQNAAILAGQDNTQNTVSYYISLAAANNISATPIATPAAYSSASGVVYARVSNNNNPSCFSVTSFNLSVIPTPVVADPADVSACVYVGYTLPALTVGQYFSQPGGIGPTIAAGTLITSSQTIYIYAQSNTVPNCTVEQSFNITITPRPVIPSLTPISLCD